MSEPLLRVWNLTKEFPVQSGLFRRQAASVHAVDGVDFHIDSGETLGPGRRIRLRQVDHRALRAAADRADVGQITFEGRNVMALDAGDLRTLRRDIQIIFQDPYASLNPRMTVGAIIGEALIIHQLTKTKRAVRGAHRRAAGDRRSAGRSHDPAVRTSSPAASASASALRARLRSSRS